MGFDGGASNRSTIEVIDLSDNTTVASGGGTNNQDLTPPAGYLYRILSIRLSVPAIGGASGSHQTEIFFVGCGAIGESWHKASGSNGAAFYYTPTQFRDDNIAGALLCSSDVPIRFSYYNGSDTNQTGNRQIYVTVEKIPERR